MMGLGTRTEPYMYIFDPTSAQFVLRHKLFILSSHLILAKSTRFDQIEAGHI